jgi:TPR repeat protein
MEYMPQGSLFGILHNKKKSIQWETRIKWAQEIACGIVSLHADNILHRDIKSLNVLLKNDEAKLTDFGLSRVKAETRSTTKASQSVGTLSWMAPELFQRKAKFTFKSDIYSVGMTFWEIASRAIPFQDADNPELIPTWVKEGEREEIPADCPPKFASAIQTCWDALQENRPTSTELAEFLLSADEAVTEMPEFLQAHRSANLGGYQDNLNSGAVIPASQGGYRQNLDSAPVKSPLQGQKPIVPAAAAKPQPAPRPVSRLVEEKKEDPEQPTWKLDYAAVLPLAQKGHAQAQYQLGRWYQMGDGGCAKNEVKAVEWYQKAVVQNNGCAQSRLGYMYSEGQGGLQKDAVRALTLYQTALENLMQDTENADAQCALGFMYANGRGVVKNEATACAWYQRAADQGDADAKAELGRLHPEKKRAKP